MKTKSFSLTSGLIPFWVIGLHWMMLLCFGGQVASAAPDLVISVTTAGTFQQGGSVTYTFTVTNQGDSPTTGNINFSDTIPTGLVAGAASGAGWTFSPSGSQPVTGTRTTPIPAGGTSVFTLPASITANAPASITNTGTVVTAGESNSGNNTTSAVIAVTQISPDLVISVTAAGTFQQGGSVTYTFTVTNQGNGPTTAAINFSDTIPTGLIAGAASGAGWIFSGIGSQPVTGTRTTPIPAGGTSVFTLPASIAANAPASITNTGTVVTAGESNSGNNATSAVIAVTQFSPDLVISVATAGTFQQGGSVIYTFTVTNQGNGPTTAAINFSDTIPTGLIAGTPTGVGWTFSDIGSQPVTGTRTTPIPAGGTSVFTLPASITANAPASITNTGTVVTAGESNSGNNATSAVIAVTQISPDVVISVATAGTFQQGGSVTYTFTVTNQGNGPTTAAINFSDTIPTGLVAGTPTGVGWTFTVNLPSITATRTTPIPAGGTAVITLPASIAANAPASITNTGTVATAGESNSGNNANSAVISVAPFGPELSLQKTTASVFRQGGTAIYQLTVKNTGTGPTTSAYTLSDALPPGVTIFGSPAGSGWSFTGTTSTTLSASRTTVLAAGQTAPAVSFSVRLSPTLASLLTNTAHVSGGGDVNGANNSGSVTVNVLASPEIAVSGDRIDIENGTNKVSVDDGTDFGPVSLLGSAVTRSFTITNLGEGDLAIDRITMTGPGEPDFVLEEFPPSVLPRLSEAEFKITFLPSALGERRVTVRIDNNDLDETSFTFDIAGTGLTSLEAWRLRYFGSTANAGNGADTFDPDRDGLTNLVEFAFGLHPLRPGTGPLPQPTITPAGITYNFTQPADVDGIIYRAERSATLGSSDWIALPDTGSGLIHHFTAPGAGTDRLFTRVKIVRQ